MGRTIDTERKTHAKAKPLSLGLERQTPARIAAATAEAPKSYARPIRSGRVMVAGHFAPEVPTALKVVAARECTTVQALLAEGINTIFAKRGKPEIADLQ